MDANAARGIASRRRESNAGVQHPAELRQAPADTKTVRAPRTPRPVLAPRQPAPVLQPRPPRTPRGVATATNKDPNQMFDDGPAVTRTVFDERAPAHVTEALEAKLPEDVKTERKTPAPFTVKSPTWDIMLRLDKKYRKSAELEAIDLEDQGLLVKDGREYRITAFVRYVLEREFERLREKHGK